MISKENILGNLWATFALINSFHSKIGIPGAAMWYVRYGFISPTEIILFLKTYYCGSILWVWLCNSDNLAAQFAPRALIAHTVLLVYSQALFWSKLTSSFSSRLNEDRLFLGQFTTEISLGSMDKTSLGLVPFAWHSLQSKRPPYTLMLLV